MRARAGQHFSPPVPDPRWRQPPCEATWRGMRFFGGGSLQMRPVTGDVLGRRLAGTTKSLVGLRRGGNRTLDPTLRGSQRGFRTNPTPVERIAAAVGPRGALLLVGNEVISNVRWMSTTTSPRAEQSAVNLCTCSAGMLRTLEGRQVPEYAGGNEEIN